MEGDLSLFQTIVIAIVEGLTEFLPVSSTGHMIITQHILGVESTDFVKAFTFIIQFGAILSVVCLYWKNFFRLNHIMLIAGGIFMLFCDKIFGNGSEKTVLTEKRAFFIGLFQCISMIPGVSRSMATIVGGMAQKLTRKKAAEFSFFLAVPTMFAATVYKMAKLFMDGGTEIISTNLTTLIVGNVVAFIVALLAIKFFISFVTKYGFVAFGWYRIIVGSIILIMSFLGYNLELA